MLGSILALVKELPKKAYDCAQRIPLCSNLAGKLKKKKKKRWESDKLDSVTRLL